MMLVTMARCSSATVFIGPRPLWYAGRVEHDLVVPPQPLEQRAAEVAIGGADDVADAALAIDGVEQALLLRVDRQVDVAMGVRAVDQHAGCARRQLLLHAQRVGQPKRNVVEPVWS